MRESIEDRIIAYFDGRLTDDESADLLHRVSVSPEIRRLFHEHEMLREIAHTAQSSAVVRPELEANLFARIEAIAASEAAGQAVVPPVEEKRKRRVVPLFWTRWRLGLATAAGAFLIGTAVTMGPEWFGRDEQLSVIDSNTPHAPRDLRELKTTPSDGSTITQAPVTSPDKFESPSDLAQEPKSKSKFDYTAQVRGDRTYTDRQVPNERRAPIGVNTFEQSNGSQNVAADVTSDVIANTTTDQAITSIDPKQQAQLQIGGEKGIAPPFRPQDLERESPDRFEATVQSSTGFAYPASDPGVKMFSDARFMLGYHLDANNIVGAILTYGLFEVLPQEAVMSENPAYTSFSRDLETKRVFSPGIYYTHREYAVLGEYINVDATLGAGLIPDGYTITGEVGLRFPFSSKFSGAISFGLTRVSIDAPSMEEMMQNVTLTGPAIFEGSDVRNTLNGRIQYGLSYQF
jgi:hypothetical protein